MAMSWWTPFVVVLYFVLGAGLLHLAGMRPRYLNIGTTLMLIFWPCCLLLDAVFWFSRKDNPAGWSGQAAAMRVRPATRSAQEMACRECGAQVCTNPFCEAASHICEECARKKKDEAAPDPVDGVGWESSAVELLDDLLDAMGALVAAKAAPRVRARGGERMSFIDLVVPFYEVMMELSSHLAQLGMGDAPDEILERLEELFNSLKEEARKRQASSGASPEPTEHSEDKRT